MVRIFKKPFVLIVILVSLFCLITVIPGILKPRRDTMAVVLEVRALNRWETASYTIEKIIDQKTSGNVFQQLLFGNKILLIAHGESVAGFDLSKFSQKDVEIQGSAIVITLPAPRILYTRLDNSKTKVYDRQQGILAGSDVNFESEARQSAETAIQKAACDEQILEKASENARKVIDTMLTRFSFSKVTISIPVGRCE